MVMICFLPFFCQRYQYYPPVSIASHPMHITFFYQTVDGYRQGSYRNPQCFRYRRHIPRLPDPHRLDHMHIIIGDISKFRRYNCFCFDIHNIIEQFYQHLMKHFIRLIHKSHLSHPNFLLYLKICQSMDIHFCNYITLPLDSSTKTA